MRFGNWLAVLALLTAPCAANAQEAASAFPSRTVRIVVGFTPGGAPDVTARFIAQKLTEMWKQPVIVENRPGAGSAVAAQYVANSPADGYTLLSVTSAHAVLPAINPQLSYDTRKDFVGVTLTSTAPMWVLVAPSLGLKSVKDLIAYAKEKPDQLNYSSAGVGSLMHFGAEMFNGAAGIKAQHIPYKGPPEALTDIVTGRVQFAISPIGVSASLVKDGKLVAVGVTGNKRLSDFPDVPTMAQAGLPAFTVGTWTGLLAPAKTPPDIVAKINRDVIAILEQEDTKARWVTFGVDPATSTSAEFDKLIAADIDSFTAAARAANVQTK